MPATLGSLVLQPPDDRRLRVTLRSSRGFRLISMRPVFSVGLVPSTPMNDDRLSTVGVLAGSTSRERLLALGHRARTRSICGASEMPWIRPVSCTGKKPFGIDDVEQHGQHQRATATSSVSGWWSSTQSSARP